jgi:hypothetical protein
MVGGIRQDRAQGLFEAVIMWWEVVVVRCGRGRGGVGGGRARKGVGHT